MTIEIRNISKSYGGERILRDIDLKINSGELVALLGPSGSGKTTLLRVIAGIEQADEGSGPVLFDDVDVSNVDLGKRRIGFVFQHYALFKHMNVFENIAFGLRAKPRRERPSEAQIREKTQSLLDLIQLGNLSQRYPSQLSGGQRQRVALARALAVEPRVLLLDEPFGALDATVRRELRRWLRRLHDTIHVTTIFVTHDQEEALEVSDRVAVMNAGRIEQYAPPQEVYEKPASPFVFKFLGNYNLFHGRTRGDEPGEALVRPHDIAIARDPNAAGASARPGVVTHIGFGGAVVKIELETEDKTHVDVEVSAPTFRDLNLKRGDKVWFALRNAQEYVPDFVI
ncbi:sulfate transport system ATP-binding protein [Rhodoblastus acidophilus]|uniref:Sulfate transport system ATP-binding protein n=1 Tax=Rhodoblastus acidophilus TaxID=1074 RepID=A0A212S374_RHOAC|nr:TOBE-like domain-containing protein [Rhodoblastus acidophilus]MCW2318191.1 sulfate transport system ATP-binding protein [Rhodoblastus acidophilus]PPQ37604.1 sulfate ABC transporter ATP-binding protein [Rhodoblastus acidophilus]RAI19115.1 sulfate ABC transporter ATP-binding protein [Rhodoblastus acidophilus]SNB79458.1 sulfate transport system ATP-binding protein [Rhodoblastus acidophilus]